MNTLYYTFFNSPIGELLIVSSEKGLVAIHLNADDHQKSLKIIQCQFTKSEWIEESSRKEDVIQQLKEYFAGKRKTFDCPIDLRGSDFKRKALRAVAKIPFGKTATYGEIAKKLNQPKAARAVGAANRTNPIPIIIPCHRIIGSDGSLTGYAGGLEIKQWLLEFEKSH